MKKHPLLAFWLFLAGLMHLVYLFCLGVDYRRTVWEMRLPVFARKIFGDGSTLRTYAFPGYRINVRGSFSPAGRPEGPALMDFFLLGQRVGGSFQSED